MAGGKAAMQNDASGEMFDDEVPGAFSNSPHAK